MSVNFVGLGTNCPDWSNGQGQGGLGAYNIGQYGANTSRFKIVSAVPQSGYADLFAGQEYFSFNISINNLKTAGTGNCSGCTVPVCLVYNSIKITTPIGANDRTWVGNTNGTDSRVATWQGGGAPTTPNGIGCPAATPTRSSTWGAVKGLYR